MIPPSPFPFPISPAIRERHYHLCLPPSPILCTLCISSIISAYPRPLYYAPSAFPVLRVPNVACPTNPYIHCICCQILSVHLDASCKRFVVQMVTLKAFWRLFPDYLYRKSSLRSVCLFRSSGKGWSSVALYYSQRYPRLFSFLPTGEYPGNDPDGPGIAAGSRMAFPSRREFFGGQCRLAIAKLGGWSSRRALKGSPRALPAGYSRKRHNVRVDSGFGGEAAFARIGSAERRGAQSG